MLVWWTSFISEGSVREFAPKVIFPIYFILKQAGPGLDLYFKQTRQNFWL